MLGLCVLGRKVNSASAEVQMLNLNPDEFTYPTAKFVNYLKHQLMIIVVNTIKELAKLIYC